jgi:hypothetical protein
MTRYAKIKLRGSDTPETVAVYLPENYEVIADSDDTVWIAGEDHAGWTLDAYVLPRLASGLMFGEEIDDWDPVEEGV